MAVPSSTVTSASLMAGTSGGSGNVVASSTATVQEFSVRVPKSDKPMQVMRFNGALNVDISKWSSLKMVRDDHANRAKSTHIDFSADPDAPKFGAGSEYGREAREEARRRKYGGNRKKVSDEDQPWVLKAQTADKLSRKFKGLREGTISENASYFVFTQATDGQFEAFPVTQWYNFTPVQTYKSLTAEEAEEQFGRRDKIMNYFNVMMRKKVKGDDDDDGDKDDEKPGKRGKGSKNSDLKVSEMEDWDDVNEMDSDDDDDDDDGGKKAKPKGKAGKKGKGKAKKKGSDSEANEDSDDGDGEGRELDYISDTSASSEDNEDENGPKKDDLVGVDQESGLRDLLDTDSSEDEEKKEEKEEDEDEADKGKKPKTPKAKKPKKKAGEGNPQENLSDESDDDDLGELNNEADSSIKPAAVAEKEKVAVEESPEPMEDRKRKAKQAIAGANQAAKKPKMEVSPALLQTAASEGITEEAVRRYLLRKPMTTTELLQKFKSKKTKVSSEDMVTVIASILKKINPTKRNQNNRMYLYLKN